MTVFIFAPRFRALVKVGAKTQTIRDAGRKPAVRVGDTLSLRAWSGRAYWTPQIVLATGVCLSVEPVRLDDVAGELSAEVAGVRIPPEDLAAFARADGFGDPRDMLRYNAENRELPFAGVLVKWTLIDVPDPGQ